MHWTDRIEKVGRLVLWLSMASAVVLVPVTYARMRAEEAQRAEQARLEAERTAKEGAKEGRLTLQSMGNGPVLRLLRESAATGSVWFSNVSDRSGIVCLAGVVYNTATKGTSESLPTCKQVPAYASNVEIDFMFAGAELGPLCKVGSCVMSVKDVPDVVAPTPPPPQPPALAATQ